MLTESCYRKGERLTASLMSHAGCEWVGTTGDAQGRVTGRFRREVSGVRAACHGGKAGQSDGSFAPVTAGRDRLGEPIRPPAKQP